MLNADMRNWRILVAENIARLARMVMPSGYILEGERAAHMQGLTVMASRLEELNAVSVDEIVDFWIASHPTASNGDRK